MFPLCRILVSEIIKYKLEKKKNLSIKSGLGVYYVVRKSFMVLRNANRDGEKSLTALHYGATLLDNAETELPSPGPIPHPLLPYPLPKINERIKKITFLSKSLQMNWKTCLFSGKE